MRGHPFGNEDLQERLRIAIWGSDEQLAMTRLVRSFPSLRGAAGIEPWNPRAFVAWVCSSDMSPSGELAARFVLQVWAPQADWRRVAEYLGVSGERLGHFDAVDAMRRWDDVHRRAFAAWAATPFFGTANAVVQDP